LLPHENDDEKSLASAAWLMKRQREDLETIVINAVSKAFSGS